MARPIPGQHTVRQVDGEGCREKAGWSGHLPADQTHDQNIWTRHTCAIANNRLATNIRPTGTGVRNCFTARPAS